MRVRLTIEYDLGHEGKEISKRDIELEQTEWIVEVISNTKMLKGKVNPSFSLERIES